MREDVANVDYLPAIFNDHDEAVLVAADIEHGELPKRVSMPIIPPGFRKVLPASHEHRWRVKDWRGVGWDVGFEPTTSRTTIF
jgi:hypothetical protein